MFEKNNKTTTIQFRVTEQEKDFLKRMATENGNVTVTDYIKFCINKEVEALHFDRSDLLIIKDLIECEIARKAKSDSLDSHNKKDLLSVLNKVNKEFDSLYLSKNKE